MITGRCVECGATSLDGLLSHASNCSAVRPPTITLESRMPATELIFDNAKERKAFMKKLQTAVAWNAFALMHFDEAQREDLDDRRGL